VARARHRESGIAETRTLALYGYCILSSAVITAAEGSSVFTCDGLFDLYVIKITQKVVEECSRNFWRGRSWGTRNTQLHFGNDPGPGRDPQSFFFQFVKIVRYEI